MARLDRETIMAFEDKLQNNTCPWMLATYSLPDGSQPKTISGVLGFIDWRLHGRLARLLQRNLIRSGEAILFPNENRLNQASLLVFPENGKPVQEKKVVNCLSGLGVQEICLIESTFNPEKFTALKKSLTNHQIQWTII